jgi:hypothetical protein
MFDTKVAQNFKIYSFVIYSIILNSKKIAPEDPLHVLFPEEISASNAIIGEGTAKEPKRALQTGHIYYNPT